MKCFSRQNVCFKLFAGLLILEIHLACQFRFHFTYKSLSLKYKLDTILQVCLNFLYLYTYIKNVSLISVCRIINWTEEHDSIFCWEIIFVNPFSANKKSVQRSALWQKVADTSITDPVFYVDKRSVREHIGVLVQRFKRKFTFIVIEISLSGLQSKSNT